jgi:hypothetical protein
VEKYRSVGQATDDNMTHALQTHAPKCYVLHTLPVLYLEENVQSLFESCFGASELTTLLRRRYCGF